MPINDRIQVRPASENDAWKPGSGMTNAQRRDKSQQKIEADSTMISAPTYLQFDDASIPGLTDGVSVMTDAFSKDPLLKEFYEYDYIPRLNREIPSSPSRYTLLRWERNIPTSYTFAQKQSSIGLTSPNGIKYASTDGTIPRWMAAHEMAHYLRNKKMGGKWQGFDSNGYSDREFQNLNNAYGGLLAQRLGYNSERKEKEMGAINTQTRYQIWRQLRENLGRRPSMEETDAYINSLSSDQLKEIFQSTRDGYTTKADMQQFYAPAVQDALIHVAANASKNPRGTNLEVYSPEVSYAKHGMKLIPKCQSNAGNALGKLKQSLNTQIQQGRTAQQQAEHLNSSNRPVMQSMREGLQDLTNLTISESTAIKADADRAYNTAVKDEIAYYNSPEYKQRLQRAGAAASNSREQAKAVASAEHGYLNEQEAQDVYKSSNAASAGMPGTLKAVNIRQPRKVGNRTLNPGVYFNTGLVNNDVYGTWAHELSHFSDKLLTPEAKAWNHKLIEGNLAPGVNSYYKEDTEIRARALPILLHYLNNKDDYGSWENFLKANQNNKSIYELRKTFKDDASFMNYMQNFVYNAQESENFPERYMAKFGAKLIKKNNNYAVN